jgi:hypothetical protein
MYLSLKTKLSDLENLPRLGPIVEFRKLNPFKEKRKFDLFIIT